MNKKKYAETRMHPHFFFKAMYQYITTSVGKMDELINFKKSLTSIFLFKTTDDTVLYNVTLI